MNDTPTLNLACDLIRRASVTPADEGCQALLADRLAAIGFRIQHLRFEDVDNLWAVHGDSGPLFVFAGHTDVVPSGPHQAWSTPPFEPTLKNGYLYGRGAADMKGSLASMVIAAEQYVRAAPDHPGRIAFLLTSDEEGIAANGTVKVMAWLAEQGEQIAWCIVGEPSSTDALGDVIKNGRRGSLGATLTVKGKQGHVAYPHLARNPIHLVAPALAELAQTQWDQGNQFFPATSFQISNIAAGTGATNVIPGECQVTFNFRFSTELTADELQQRTEALLTAHGLDFRIVWHLSGEPFLTGEGALVTATCAAVDKVTGRVPQLSTAGGTSDGRFIAPSGAEVVELGPVNATIHQTDECVRVADLEQLTDVYREVLAHLLEAGDVR